MLINSKFNAKWTKALLVSNASIVKAVTYIASSRFRGGPGGPWPPKMVE